MGIDKTKTLQRIDFENSNKLFCCFFVVTLVNLNYMPYSLERSI